MTDYQPPIVSGILVNDNMLNLHKRLTDEKKVSESTATAYIRTLYNLNDKKPFKNFAFLKDTEKIDKLLADYADTTKKTIYATLASVLYLDIPKSGYKKYWKHYNDKMTALAQEAKEVDTSVKTTKQQDNWVSWNDVLKVSNDLKTKVESIKGKKPLGETDYQTLLDYVVLSLYTEIPPRRNQDFLSMKVYRLAKKENSADLSKDFNYLLLENNLPSSFLFNKYKTAKTYGSQSITIPPPLRDTLSIYLKYHLLNTDKKVKEFAFLVSQTGVPIEADNAITRILNRLFNKKVGSSMLRHIYLSDKYKIDDMKKDAEAMGHSILQQKEYMKGEGSTSQRDGSPESALSPLEDTLPVSPPPEPASLNSLSLDNSVSSVPQSSEPT